MELLTLDSVVSVQLLQIAERELTENLLNKEFSLNTDEDAVEYVKSFFNCIYRDDMVVDENLKLEVVGVKGDELDLKFTDSKGNTESYYFDVEAIYEISRELHENFFCSIQTALQNCLLGNSLALFYDNNKKKLVPEKLNTVKFLTQQISPIVFDTVDSVRLFLDEFKHYIVVNGEVEILLLDTIILKLEAND